MTIDPTSLFGAVWVALLGYCLRLSEICSPAISRDAWPAFQACLDKHRLYARIQGEFSIIMANIGKMGGLLPVVQSFAVLYVLILAVLGPLLTKESERIYGLFGKPRQKPKPKQQHKGM